MAKAQARGRYSRALTEVTEFDTIAAFFRVTCVFVALAFSLASKRIFDPSVYAITTLFLLLQAGVLVGIARKANLARIRPFVMAIDILVFCAWMREEPAYARGLFALFYLTVPMAAMNYRLPGSLIAAGLAIGVFLWQAPPVPPERETAAVADQPGAGMPVARPPETWRDTWRAMAPTHFIPLLLVAVTTGVLAAVRDREREVRFAREMELFEYRERLDLARAVQEFSLPSSLPEIPGYELGHAFEAADYAIGGGDYFDVRLLSSGLFAICVADVAGKTISGVAKLPLVRWGFEVVTDMVSGPSEAAARLNELYCDAIEDDSFISVTLATLDPETGRLLSTAAGQPAPMIVRATGSGFETLEQGGPTMGVIPGATYECAETELGPGALAIFYSDGLLTAAKSSGEELGFDRIAIAARKHIGSSAQAVADALHELAREFGEPRHMDDLTVLVVKRRRYASG